MGSRRAAIRAVLLAGSLVLACGSNGEPSCPDACAPGTICVDGVCRPADGGTDGESAVEDDASDPAEVGEDSPGADDRGGEDAPRESDGRDATDAEEETDTTDGETTCDPGAVEQCNGLDDDCDTACDEGFACCRGGRETCLTTCGTSGFMACTDGCTLAEACTPPAEVCNGEDDDCDTVCDNGLGCCRSRTTTCRTTCDSIGSVLCSDACAMPAYCPPPAEHCGDGADDDCDGLTDEDCTSNDTCAEARRIVPDTIQTGSTVAMVDDTHACGWDGGRDVYFFFDLATRTDVYVHGMGTEFDTIMYASATCGMSDLGCNDDIISWLSPSHLHLTGLAPGRYYVTIDGFQAGAFGNYTIQMYQSAPSSVAAEGCGRPGMISSRVTGSRASGDTCGMRDDEAGTCGGAGGRDAIFFFVMEERHAVTISTCNSTTTWDTILYLRSLCSALPAEIACSDDAGAAACPSNPAATVFEATLEEGMYFLILDAHDASTCGRFQVNVSPLFW